MNDEERRDKMTELALSFPCLQRAWGIEPFGPGELKRWAAAGVSSGERITASFILTVWDSSTQWETGRFDLMEALNVWPPSHRVPFLNWASNPWWP